MSAVTIPRDKWRDTILFPARTLRREENADNNERSVKFSIDEEERCKQYLLCRGSGRTKSECLRAMKFHSSNEMKTITAINEVVEATYCLALTNGDVEKCSKQFLNLYKKIQKNKE